MTIPHFFVEGKTETKILEKLKLIDPVTIKQETGGKGDEIARLARDRANEATIMQETGGKDGLNKRMIKVLGPNLGSKPIRCLVMRDLDSHDDETTERIRSSVENALRKMFDERDFALQSVSLTAHDRYENVFTFQATDPNIKVALHIATHCCLDHFIKSTVDDYVLDLAFRDSTAESFLQKKKNRDRNWTISADALINQVRQEIPDLLQKNGIPPLGEAKDYVQFYLAVLQMPTSPPVFAEKTMAHARESDIQEVFAPLLAAAQFLSDDPVTV
jgi:hypothetical protein